MSVLHSETSNGRRQCWNCDYWDPVMRRINNYGDTEEQGPGECRCRTSSDYGKQTYNGHSCSKFSPWR